MQEQPMSAVFQVASLLQPKMTIHFIEMPLPLLLGLWAIAGLAFEILAFGPMVAKEVNKEQPGWDGVLEKEV
jgi:hypothetical protein